MRELHEDFQDNKPVEIETPPVIADTADIQTAGRLSLNATVAAGSEEALANQPINQNTERFLARLWMVKGELLSTVTQDKAEAYMEQLYALYPTLNPLLRHTSQNTINNIKLYLSGKTDQEVADDDSVVEISEVAVRQSRSNFMVTLARNNYPARRLHKLYDEQVVGRPARTKEKKVDRYAQTWHAVSEILGRPGVSELVTPLADHLFGHPVDTQSKLFQYGAQSLLGKVVLNEQHGRERRQDGVSYKYALSGAEISLMRRLLGNQYDIYAPPRTLQQLIQEETSRRRPYVHTLEDLQGIALSTLQKIQASLSPKPSRSSQQPE